MYQSHAEIIDIWPTQGAFARAINIDYNRARQWHSRNRIPAEYWVLVVNAAHEMDAPVTYRLLAELVAKHKKTPTC